MPGLLVKRAFVNLSRHLRFLNRRKLGKETGHFQESGRQGRGKQRLGGKGEKIRIPGEFLKQSLWLVWRSFPVVLLINRLPISQRLPVEKVYQRWNLLVLFSIVCGNIWSGTYQEVLSFRSLSGRLSARFCPTLALPVFSFTKSKMTAQWTIAS